MAKNRTIAAYRHKQKASNAPTQETAVHHTGPVPILTAPPSDRGPREPQLWWRSEEPRSSSGGGGGWQQFAPRLYTQEKIVPQQYVESLLKAGSKGQKPDLFFKELNGLTSDQYFEPYQHQGNWLNRLIRGESSQVMASLLEHEGMAGSVQMVYFDPPYGIGFDSNFQSLTGRPGARKGAQADVETVKAFRDRYHDGLHSYMDALHRNLVLVRELLTESGSVFIQMGAENMPEVFMVAQHVFGKENKMNLISYATAGAKASSGLAEINNYLIWFAKDKEKALEAFNPLYEENTRENLLELMSFHGRVELADGTVRKPTEEELADPTKLPDGCRLFQRRPLTSMGVSTTRSIKYTYKGRDYEPTPSVKSACWRVSKEGLDRLVELDRISETEDTLMFKLYEDERPGNTLHNVWGELMRPSDKRYAVETAGSVIERCILMTSKPGDLVLDITCGSGTTAFVAEQCGRRWITMDTSAVPIALTRQRIATGVHPYHLLQDSPEGAAKERELGGTPLENPGGRDPAKGFVYKRTIKVTAGSLAYDEEPQTVLLVNQPEFDPKKVRVSAPFCVQNANAIAYLPLSDEFDNPEADSHRSEEQVTLERLENALQTSGIKYSNGVKGRVTVQNLKSYGERIPLTNPEEADGVNRGYVTHTADVTMPDDKDNPKPERAALTIVGFHRRVAATLTNHAVAEANEMPGIKHLIVIGFEFESSVQRGRRKRGQLNVVQVQANTDLAIGELSDNQSDDSFVMLGEPELVITQTKNGKYQVEVKGFMTHDPTTGNIRSNGPGDIHCWMLDSDYDRKSFMCRDLHLMNPEDRQLKRLKTALGNLLDPKAWARMTSMNSTPFPLPSNEEHLIAVRIVTTTGAELTAVRDVTRKL